MNTTNILLAIAIGGIALVIALLYKNLQKLKGGKEDSKTPFSQISQKLEGMETRTSNTLQEVQKNFSNKMDNTSKTISQLNRELEKVEQLNKQMNDLQSMIKSPKLRGNIGEKIMENLLKDCLPKKSYDTQYQFENGSTVDAIVKIKEEIIPIDSKFPIENFEKIIKSKKSEEKKVFKKNFIRDVKKHIKDIAKKYIRPEEGTVDFAVMYVPSETIFYTILKSEKLYDYAAKRKIYITSPNIFHYFLQTIMIGIERNQISKKTRQVLYNLKGIQRDAKEFAEILSLTDKHLSNARKQMGQAKESFSDLKHQIDNTAQIKKKAQKEVKKEQPTQAPKEKPKEIKNKQKDYIKNL